MQVILLENIIKLGKIGDLVEVKNGYGRKVLSFLEVNAERLGAKIITLHAQLHAKEFYIDSRYEEKGNIFIEANIPHIEMYKIL